MWIIFDVVLVLTPLLLLTAFILLVICDNQSKRYFNTKDYKSYDVYKLKRPFEMKGYTFTRIAYDENNEPNLFSEKKFAEIFIKIKGFKNDG